MVGAGVESDKSNLDGRRPNAVVFLFAIISSATSMTYILLLESILHWIERMK
jgi:hypothetical protein